MVKLFPPNARTEFVDLVCGGMSVLAAARRVGASHVTGGRWWAQSGQMMTVNMGAVGGLADPAPSPEGPGGRALKLEERGMIQMGLRSGLSYARIGEAIGRDKSVVWREVKRNTSADGVYYASVAHTKSPSGPAPSQAVEAGRGRGAVPADRGVDGRRVEPETDLRDVGVLYFPDDQTMQVSHETIYQALYVQTRGSLRADLAEKLSLQRKQRVPHTTNRPGTAPTRRRSRSVNARPKSGTGRCPGTGKGIS